LKKNILKLILEFRLKQKLVKNFSLQILSKGAAWDVGSAGCQFLSKGVCSLVMKNGLMERFAGFQLLRKNALR